MKDARRAAAKAAAASDPTELFREFSRELRRSHQRSLTLPHDGERALERESTLVRLLNGLIPSRFRAARGFILYEREVDRRQIDCVLYDSHNYGARSNQGHNVIALAKSVGAVAFETINLTPRKFKEDVDRIEAIKRRLEADRSFDPLPPAPIRQAAGYIVASDALDNNGEPWNVLSAYQQEFKRLDEDRESWRFLPDGVLVLNRGHFYGPVVRFDETGQFTRTFLSALEFDALPLESTIGLADGPGNVDDAGDHLLETLRSHLMAFKNQHVTGPFTLQVNLGQITTFARNIRRTAQPAAPASPPPPGAPSSPPGSGPS